MKKLVNYRCVIKHSATDNTQIPVEFQPLSDYFGAAVDAESFIEELPLGRSERKQLYEHIRKLLDRAVSDACIQFSE